MHGPRVLSRGSVLGSSAVARETRSISSTVFKTVFNVRTADDFPEREKFSRAPHRPRADRIRL